MKIQGDRSRHDFFTILGINRPAVIVSDIEGVRSGQKPQFPVTTSESSYQEIPCALAIHRYHFQVVGDPQRGRLRSLGGFRIPYIRRSAHDPTISRPRKRHMTVAEDDAFMCFFEPLDENKFLYAFRSLKMGSTCNRLLSTLEESKWCEFLPCPWKRGIRRQPSRRRS